MHRIIVIDDTQAIHEDFKKILCGGSAATSALEGAKAALFGSSKSAAPVASPTNFEVDFALQGEEGLHRLQKSVAEGRPYSMAFVDMRMPPGWDGLQTIQRLWECDPDLQVVICSAYSDHSWEDISERLGLTDRLLILKKPFDPIEVRQLAAALCEKRALARQAALKLDELERLVQQRTADLEHAAMHDRLTGLSNRVLFRDRLARCVERHLAQGNWPYALLFIDFDRFKVVNDSLGHDAGDQLLIEISRRLKEYVSSPECLALCQEILPARMGGDEFVVLVEGLRTPDAGARIAEELLDRFSMPHQLKGYNIISTASIGITSSELGYHQAEDVLRNADVAMYQAKAAGKAKCVVFDRSMLTATLARLAMEKEIRGIVDRNELVLYYQPVVSLETGKLRGFEALVRWNHPTRGLVPPDEFISCAEDTGMIVSLGRWVLREACRQLREWLRMPGTPPHLTMSVNVSANQLVSRQFLDEVQQEIQSSGINPALLGLEITESVVVADADFTFDLLQQVRKLGVRLYMDDFGTGYTSLSYLHRLPLTGLKMDRTFMQSVAERRDYAAVVQAIITLSQNLGLEVVAEGVETPDQVAMLQSMACDLAQGYLFGRPVPASEAVTHFAQRLAPAA